MPLQVVTVSRSTVTGYTHVCKQCHRRGKVAEKIESGTSVIVKNVCKSGVDGKFQAAVSVEYHSESRTSVKRKKERERERERRGYKTSFF